MRTLALVFANASLRLPPEQASVHHKRLLPNLGSKRQRGEQPLTGRIHRLQGGRQQCEVRLAGTNRNHPEASWFLDT